MKYAKRFLCMLLIFTMLLPIIVACDKNAPAEDTETEAPTAEDTAAGIPEGALSKDDIAKLVIIRAADATDEVNEAINELKKQFKSVFGVTTKILTDKNSSEEGAIELLIGQTTRKQSKNAIKELKGFGYVMGNFDGSIVINSAYDYYLIEAIERFKTEYVVEGAEYLALPKELISEEKTANIFAENGTYIYGLVSEVGFEDDVKLFSNKMFAYTSAKLPDTSKLKPTMTECEVLIGETDRPESKEALKLISYDEAIITFINKKLVVRGWFSNTTDVALAKLMEIIESYYDANKKCVFLPSDFNLVIGTEQDFKLDIPSYDGGKITCAQDVGEENFLFYIENTNETEYEAYKTKLTSNGYTLYTQYNDLNSVKSATYKSADTMIHVYYLAKENAVRIVTAPMEDTTLPPVVSEPTSVQKITTSSITQVMLDYYNYSTKDDGNFGNCYVIRLDDGSLLIYDGGNQYGDADVERLWAVMNKQATKKNGKIVVAGWIVTHEHSDHIWGMYNVLKKYGSQIKLEAVYYNRVTEDVATIGGGRTNFFNETMMSELQRSVGDFAKVRLHTGQRFWVRNAMVEVIYTPEDMYPNGINDYKKYQDFNDTSMVTRVTIDGTKFINLGDSYAVASNTMVATYGNELKSDLSTIAHHGWGGGSKALYDCIDADRYFMPFSQKAYDRIMGGTDNYIQWAIRQYNAYNYPFYEVLQHIGKSVEVNGDGGARNIIVADHYNKELSFSDIDNIIIHEDNRGHNSDSQYSTFDGGKYVTNAEYYKNVNK